MYHTNSTWKLIQIRAGFWWARSDRVCTWARRSACSIVDCFSRRLLPWRAWNWWQRWWFTCALQLLLTVEAADAEAAAVVSIFISASDNADMFTTPQTRRWLFFWSCDHNPEQAASTNCRKAFLHCTAAHSPTHSRHPPPPFLLLRTISSVSSEGSFRKISTCRCGLL